MRLTVSPRARQDVAAISRRSGAEFGKVARDRYMALIQQAFADLLDDPARRGVRSEPSLQATLRLYHLRHSRQTTAGGGRIGSPRHYVVFRIIHGDELEIVCLLHDAMDLPSRLADL